MPTFTDAGIEAAIENDVSAENNENELWRRTASILIRHHVPCHHQVLREEIEEATVGGHASLLRQHNITMYRHQMPPPRCVRCHVSCHVSRFTPAAASTKYWYRHGCRHARMPATLLRYITMLTIVTINITRHGQIRLLAAINIR